MGARGRSRLEAARLKIRLLQNPSPELGPSANGSVREGWSKDVMSLAGMLGLGACRRHLQMLSRQFYIRVGIWK